MTTKTEVLEALKVLFVDETIEDYVYNVKEHELQGWTGPRVMAFGEACDTLKRVMKELDKS